MADKPKRKWLGIIGEMSRVIDREMDQIILNRLRNPPKVPTEAEIQEQMDVGKKVLRDYPITMKKLSE